MTLEEAYGSSSGEEGDAAFKAADADDDASSVSGVDADAMEEVPDSDCSSDVSLASEAESASPPTKKRKVCGCWTTPSQGPPPPPSLTCGC